MKWFVLICVVLVVALSCGSCALVSYYGPVFFTNWRSAITPSSESVDTPQDPVVVAPTTPVPQISTPCGTWDTTPGVTNWLVPGASARGDVVVNGVEYYDNGTGEGTTIINLSDEPIKVYAEWGSGCEATVDVKFLVNKDLEVGCGSSCTTARVVVVTDEGVTEEFHSSPLP